MRPTEHGSFCLSLHLLTQCWCMSYRSLDLLCFFPFSWGRETDDSYPFLQERSMSWTTVVKSILVVITILRRGRFIEIVEKEVSGLCDFILVEKKLVCWTGPLQITFHFFFSMARYWLTWSLILKFIVLTEEGRISRQNRTSKAHSKTKFWTDQWRE